MLLLSNGIPSLVSCNGVKISLMLIKGDVLCCVTFFSCLAFFSRVTSGSSAFVDIVIIYHYISLHIIFIIAIYLYISLLYICIYHFPFSLCYPSCNSFAGPHHFFCHLPSFVLFSSYPSAIYKFENGFSMSKRPLCASKYEHC